tara:strand:- start:8 stop:289 length:282 start_codon:yes stop_codon:yes gene_type:complete
MKIKVIKATHTVWLQETKQVDIELDGKSVAVRQMEDDNGAETYVFSEQQNRFINVNELKDIDYKSTIRRIAHSIFMDAFNEENSTVDFNELEE